MAANAIMDPGGPALGCLEGVKIVDLTRILAGPTATQLLADLGADVIKIEKPNAGDDTRKWGPPYVAHKDGGDTHESAYYLCANRNKRSVTVDVASEGGQQLIRRLLKDADVLVENFKVGGLAKYGLSYEDLKTEFPRLVYCSVTGFGQTGPYAPKAGYDFLAQAMGGIMSITGDPEGKPVKVGVGISDVMCGMYATVGILAALRHRDRTGEGQYVDTCLYDTSIAWLINEGTNYLVSGNLPKRRGNQHPNIVPYDVYPSADGHFVIACGNDGQFSRLANLLGHPEWVEDERFATNQARCANREAMTAKISAVTSDRPQAYWIAELDKISVPVSRVSTFDQVFSDDHTQARGMKIDLPHHQAAEGTVPLIGNPLTLSGTPIRYRHAPPTMGQHTDDVLREWLGITSDELDQLRGEGSI